MLVNVATLFVLTMVTVCESYPHQLFVYLFLVIPDTNLFLLFSSLGALSSVHLITCVGLSIQTVSHLMCASHSNWFILARISLHSLFFNQFFFPFGSRKDCGSRPPKQFVEPAQQSTVWTRCGTSEINAREFCGEPCTWQCTKPGESCVGIHSNYCDSVVPE